MISAYFLIFLPPKYLLRNIYANHTYFYFPVKITFCRNNFTSCNPQRWVTLSQSRGFPEIQSWRELCVRWRIGAGWKRTSDVQELSRWSITKPWYCRQTEELGPVFPGIQKRICRWLWKDTEVMFLPFRAHQALWASVKFHQDLNFPLHCPPQLFL